MLSSGLSDRDYECNKSEHRSRWIKIGLERGAAPCMDESDDSPEGKLTDRDGVGEFMGRQMDRLGRGLEKQLIDKKMLALKLFAHDLLPAHFAQVAPFTVLHSQGNATDCMQGCAK